MRLSKSGYYADLVIYPIVVIALAIAGIRNQHSHLLAAFFLCCVLGLAAWTFVEYAMHRFLLHSIGTAADLHWMHHANPGAFIGTPSWLSLAAFAAVFIAMWALAGTEIASGAVSGLVIGYIWYLVVHDAVHRWRLDRSSLLYKAKLRHVSHHHCAGRREGNFGVTTAFWDRCFGTVLDFSPGKSRNDRALADRR